MKRIVLDANILVRAALGKRVVTLLERYEENVVFYCPDVCLKDARRYIPEVAMKRGVDPVTGLRVFDKRCQLLEVVDHGLYEEHEASAMSRIAHRDADDWPIVATALLLDCPIWTEDQDFFGSGVATWTTRTVEVYLRDAS